MSTYQSLRWVSQGLVAFDKVIRLKPNRSTKSKWVGIFKNTFSTFLSTKLILLEWKSIPVPCLHLSFSLTSAQIQRLHMLSQRSGYICYFLCQSWEQNPKSVFQISMSYFMAWEMWGCCRWKPNSSIYCQKPPGKTCRVKRTYISLCSSESSSDIISIPVGTSR